LDDANMEERKSKDEKLSKFREIREHIDERIKSWLRQMDNEN